MFANMGELVFIILFIAVGIAGTLIKKHQEAKERERRLRELHPGTSAKPIIPVRSKPETGKPPVSPLQKAQQFFREIQEQARRQQRRGAPPPPKALPSRQQPQAARVQQPRGVRRVVRRAEPAAVVPEKEKPKVEAEKLGLAERLAAREKEPAGRKEQPRVPVPGGAPTKAKPRVSRLRSILESNRSDLGRAILLSEILGNPVVYRGSPIPRYRN